MIYLFFIGNFVRPWTNNVKQLNKIKWFLEETEIL
jgi:hypothetical protein